MCVKPMEENDEDKVVSMIINYFTARVNMRSKETEWRLVTVTFAHRRSEGVCCVCDTGFSKSRRTSFAKELGGR
ncbi:hypothetical protein WN48_09700 [Eufriesea mexicana]|uniref:Uncharacterized protein n=1 Tax=Eufriesea mexicana TaxID=516756 RepID=A0A310SL39_9HYME|nr:hypothetical protein WN48_09700 [Eufriesea mexicana]